MKRIVILCDGTWSDANTDPVTNVRRLAQMIPARASDGTEQLVQLQEGVGSRWFERLQGGAFGSGISQKIQAAYQILCENYLPGDEIYFFGYSRGAYTVRSLAGLINAVGLLASNQIRAIDDAYKIYRIQNSTERAEQSIKFQQRYATQRPPIALLGCWDTVGSLGIPDLLPNLPIDYWINQPFRFHDTQLSNLIRNAIHAVALDEQQKVLELTPMEVPAENTTRLVQRWFPGDHGQIAKRVKQSDPKIVDPNQRERAETGLADLTLVWMIEQVRKLGLSLEFNDAAIQQLSPDFLAPPIVDLFDDRMKEPWKLNFITLPGLKTRELKVTPNAENRAALFHSSVSGRWCNSASRYRSRCLVEQQWETVFDAACSK
jgi:uncharacterized protein (DUF2235 family)